MGILNWFYTPTYKDNAKATEESARCRAYKKEIITLDEINQRLTERCRELAAIKSADSEQGMYNRLIDIGEKLLSSGVGTNPPVQPPTGNTDVNGKSGDSQTLDIDKLLEDTPHTIIKVLATAPRDKVAEQAKIKFPNITDSQIDEAISKSKIRLEAIESVTAT